MGVAIHRRLGQAETEAPLIDESVFPVATKLVLLGVVMFLWTAWKNKHG